MGHSERYVDGGRHRVGAAGVSVGKAEELFRLGGDIRSFAPSRDGRRFLVQEPEGELQELPMVVIENWAARLSR